MRQSPTGQITEWIDMPDDRAIIPVPSPQHEVCSGRLNGGYAQPVPAGRGGGHGKVPAGRSLAFGVAHLFPGLAEKCVVHSQRKADR